MRKHTVSADINQSCLVRANTAPVILLQNVGFVPGELVDHIGVGHRILFEEHEHALVMLGWLSDALSVDDCVGIVDVRGVDIMIALTVGGQPALDVLVSFVTPEVLNTLEDLLLWLDGGHGVSNMFLASGGRRL